MLELGETPDEGGLLRGDRPGLVGRGVGGRSRGVLRLPGVGGGPGRLVPRVLGLLRGDVGEGRRGAEAVVVGVQRTLGVLEAGGLVDDILDALGADDRGERRQPGRQLVRRHQRVAVRLALALDVRGGDLRAVPGHRRRGSGLRRPPPGAVVGLGGLRRAHAGLLEALVRDDQPGAHRGHVVGLVENGRPGIPDVLTRGRLVVGDRDAGDDPTHQDRHGECCRDPEHSHRVVPISVILAAPRGTRSTLDNFRHKRNILPRLSQKSRRVGLTNYTGVTPQRD